MKQLTNSIRIAALEPLEGDVGKRLHLVKHAKSIRDIGLLLSKHRFRFACDAGIEEHQTLIKGTQNQWIDVDGFDINVVIVTKLDESQATVCRSVLVLNANWLAKRLNFQPASLLGQPFR